MYTQVTQGIRVSINPIYLEDQSSPSDNHFVWAYQVRIDNESEQRIQLRARYWKITDALGRIQEVQGAGVVGEQPTLNPGETFEYTSGTPLTTASGIMEGLYQVETQDGASFEIIIPTFSLDSPYDQHSIN